MMYEPGQMDHSVCVCEDPVQVLHGEVLHGVEVGACVLHQGAEDEGEADAQVHVDGLDEAVGVGQRGAGARHQRGHGEHRGHAWNTRHRGGGFILIIRHCFMSCV